MKPLYRILKEYAKEDRVVLRKLKKLSNYEEHNFFFYLAVNEDDAISFFSEEKGFDWGYGIWKRKGGDAGCIFVFKDRVLFWGAESVRKKFLMYFEQWQKSGMPKLTDYTITVIPVHNEIKIDENSVLIKRRYSNIILTREKSKKNL